MTGSSVVSTNIRVVIRRHLLSGLVAALVFGVLLIAPQTFTSLTPSANAQSCPDAEVIFARGRTEPPGVGSLGNAFISALRSKTNKNIDVYAVQYPADNQVDVGANDMSGRIQYMMNTCPNTRLVLGGYSLGAAVTDVVLALPFDFFGFKAPLPPGADQHIAAVALFGNGITWAGPIGNFNPVYRDRTIDLCHGADPICSPADPHTWEGNWPEHWQGAYIDAGMPNQAADFVAARL